jgi:hypothetical protein
MDGMLISPAPAHLTIRPSIGLDAGADRFKIVGCHLALPAAGIQRQR